MRHSLRIILLGCYTGRNAWMLPAVELEYPKSLERFKWFARFLLEGKVRVLENQLNVPVLDVSSLKALDTISNYSKKWLA